ncbi:ROK family transcriptional regulator [Kineococcus radiotolerans]|uniref:ROK family protein n=1 Tax=Kineococcus radiotolerans (strain ATCC BAA-149 / DSM 14245 / SRS30216) TaxID=266940 RepID=A6W7T0_KINRD|nr:ROK family transcriptional regulator [Kineococcus radiotolerans]ABS02869.1 ROK family protein [Kineococcus radiotolerans SRS30216 = ATCC BAA-149]
MRRGTNLPWVGDYNQAVVLDGIRRHPGTSRTELAAATGLTLQTVSNIVRRLLERGLVQEGVALLRDGAGRGAGKPRTALSVRPGAALAVGVQFEREHVDAVLLDLSGVVVGVDREPLPDPLAPVELVVAHAAGLVRRLVGAGGADEGAVRGVGVAVPGPLDFTGPVRSSAINLPGWRGVAIADLLAAATGLPVLVENDATAAAVGDLWRSPRTGRSFLYVHVGAGIGGGVVLRDEVLRGDSGNAGEIGHVVVDPAGPRCPCGSRGCLEAVAAPAAVVRRYVERVGSRTARAAGLRLAGRTVLDDHDLLGARAGAGDREAARVLDAAADDVARVVLGVVNVLDVSEVVLGGAGLRRSGERVRAALAARLGTAMTREVHPVAVRLGEAGEQAGALGAAGAVLHEALSSTWAGVHAPVRQVVISPVAPVH